MTYRYFHTKLGRWRKRFAEIDQATSAAILQRATGKTLGRLCDLARRLERLGQDGNDLMAAGIELRIGRTVLPRLFGELQQLEHLSRALRDLTEKLFGADVTISDYWVDEARFRAISEEIRQMRELDEIFESARENAPTSV